MQSRMNVPDQSRPAATFAADTRPSTVGGAVCADAMTMPAATKSAVPMKRACNLM
jgi:hypothetical protein